MFGVPASLIGSELPWLTGSGLYTVRGRAVSPFPIAFGAAFTFPCCVLRGIWGGTPKCPVDGCWVGLGLPLALIELLDDLAFLLILGRSLRGLQVRGGVPLIALGNLVASLGILLVPLAVPLCLCSSGLFPSLYSSGEVADGFLADHGESVLGLLRFLTYPT